MILGAALLSVASGATEPASAQAAPVVTPSSGPWHTFVTITGDRAGTATGARVVWYPDDDASEPPLGSSSATLRGANPKSGAEFEIPAGAGGRREA